MPDAQAAITEIARVLRPGGRALLLDSDHESRVESDIDARRRRGPCSRRSWPSSPTRWPPGTCPRQAITAGLVVDPDVGSSALVYTQHG